MCLESGTVVDTGGAMNKRIEEDVILFDISNVDEQLMNFEQAVLGRIQILSTRNWRIGPYRLPQDALDNGTWT
jgi:tetrahydromethanopterin S-methyltransferase subunit B